VAERDESMTRSIKWDIPGVDWRRTTLDAVEQGFAGIFEPELSPPFELIVEIGFGRGEFLMDLAAKHPERAHLGVEISFKRVLKVARRLARSGLENVRLIEARGEVVLGELMLPGSVSEIWANFSDPWPRDSQAHRRLIQAPFVQSAARCLVQGGLLQVATDDVPYAEQIDRVLASEPRLVNAFSPEPWLPEVPGRTQTAYEAEWRAAGRLLHFFRYRRRGRIE
jgi:tRNA (guanine-N7-)-methyltransferase